MKISLCDEMIHTVLDNIEEGVYLTDGDRVVTYWNGVPKKLPDFPPMK